jgi:hypothetical protein
MAQGFGCAPTVHSLPYHQTSSPPTVPVIGVAAGCNNTSPTFAEHGVLARKRARA